MSKSSVYIETTIVSVLTARPTRDLLQAAWQEITLEWWNRRRGDFELFTSDVVWSEAERGDKDAAQRRLEVLAGIPLLEFPEEVSSLAGELVSKAALPENAEIDALHIACATVHRINYLLTWNCPHLANAELIPHIREVCIAAGYECPQVCTPEQLLGIKPWQQ